jgi:antitoxin HigA-1
MADERPNKIDMKPPHPGDFTRTEILDERHLSVAPAAEILGVRRATLSDLIHGQASLSSKSAAAACGLVGHRPRHHTHRPV